MLAISWRRCLTWGSALLSVQTGVLWFLGQPIICTCGYVKLWEGAVLSSGTSQHLSDWYTFSHIIHGFLFYALMWVLFPRMPVVQRFLIALGLEAGWEITENTPWLIGHYREQALAQGYSGDSIVNSLSDTCAMLLGFVLAWRLPMWGIIALAVAMEGVVGYAIHDNLTLNILNFIHQFNFIHRWQSGSK